MKTQQEKESLSEDTLLPAGLVLETNVVQGNGPLRVVLFPDISIRD